MTKRSIVGFYILIIVALSCNNPQEKNEKEKIPESITNNLKNNDASYSDSAVIVLNKLILEQPQNADLYAKRGQQFLGLRNFDAAIKDYQRAIKLDSVNSNYYNELAETYFLNKNLDEAFQNFSKSEKLNPKNDKTFIKRGQVHYLLKKFNEALADADAALKINKYNDQPYYLKGIVFLEVKDTLKAVSSFQTAVEQNPDNFNAYYQLGLLYTIAGKPMANDYFKSAIAINNNAIDARYALALNYQNLEEYEQAIEEYEKILNIEPKFIDAIYNIGFIYSEYLDNDKKATEYYQKCIQIDSKFVKGLYMLGLMNERSNEFKIARDYYKNVLEIQPDYTLAAKALSRVSKN
jgi:tetratricopeptide (TPR) repeat protein